MTKPLLKQFPSFEYPHTLVYLGTSMNPTMEDLDVVKFQPYRGDPLQKGDIIIIQRDEEPYEIVIHRIVAIDHDSIRTRGDNCSKIDPWILHPSDILGYVTSINRGNQIIDVDRGFAGYKKFVFERVIRGACSICRTFAECTYQKIIVLKLPARLLSPFLKCRMVTFSGTNRSESRLFLGPVCIGRLPKGSTVWEIKAPYRLLIDPALLRSIGKEQDSDIYTTL